MSLPCWTRISNSPPVLSINSNKMGVYTGGVQGIPDQFGIYDRILAWVLFFAARSYSRFASIADLRTFSLLIMSNGWGCLGASFLVVWRELPWSRERDSLMTNNTVTSPSPRGHLALTTLLESFSGVEGVKIRFVFQKSLKSDWILAFSIL